MAHGKRLTKGRVKTKPSSQSDLVPRPKRFEGIDLLRGIAVAMMVAYHFSYDLAYFGDAGWSTNDMLLQSGWISWRNGIVTLFLGLVGVSLVLRSAFKPSWADFWKRWLQIFSAALLVSIGSFFFAGERWIYFGILHFIAIALILGRLLEHGAGTSRHSTFILTSLGLAILIIGLLVSHPLFDAPPLNIIGLVTQKPRTEDYVPLLPWFGIVLIGMALGQWWKAHNFRQFPALIPLRSILPAPLQKLLIRTGSWSLTIYLLHQPILMGVLSGLHSLSR